MNLNAWAHGGDAVKKCYYPADCPLQGPKHPTCRDPGIPCGYRKLRIAARLLPWSHMAAVLLGPIWPGKNNKTHG